jgi:hypothetical protein
MTIHVTGACIADDSVRDTAHMIAKGKPAKSPMSQAHKDALAIGREEGRAVRRYLEALESHRPKRGRKRSQETIQKQLMQIDERLETADPLTRVHLVQERMDLTTESAAKEGQVDLGALEADFIKAAKNYSERKGISYAAWREAGIDAGVLKAAGLRRGSGPS